MAHLIECPHEDGWKSSEDDDAHVQVGRFLSHYADAHGSPLPDAVRDAVKGCAKQLEDLPLPTR